MIRGDSFMENEEILESISVVTKDGRIISIRDAIKSDEDCSISKGWTVLSKPLSED
ncbi:MAG: hypothetical protein AB9888_05005 [Bacteroidales bacterium]